MTTQSRDMREAPQGIGRSYVALCGGVGGAKLAFGLARVLPAGSLTIVVNTGDDFEHLGLHIAPDIDTVVYTLAGLANPETGWGRAGETWRFMAAIADLGEPDWFRLGDADLAMHVARTHRLGNGETLTEFCADVCRRLGVSAAVVPMSDQPVRTVIDTGVERLAFQEYFVHRRCEPPVKAISFEGASAAEPSPGFVAAMARADLGGIVICPSNPYLSIDPLLAVYGIRRALAERSVPAVAVSPIVGGSAVKGPTAKIMRELGLRPDVPTIAQHYDGLIDAVVADQADAGRLERTPLERPVRTTETVMDSETRRIDLARFVIAYCAELAEGGQPALARQGGGA